MIAKLLQWLQEHPGCSCSIKYNEVWGCWSNWNIKIHGLKRTSDIWSPDLATALKKALDKQEEWKMNKLREKIQEILKNHIEYDQYAVKTFNIDGATDDIYDLIIEEILSLTPYDVAIVD